MGKTSSVEECRQITSFLALRKTLFGDQFAADLDKPLAYWALPGDRRLPLAFLGRTLRDLLQSSFEELIATPGIGQKKITSLLKLLSRVAKNQTATLHLSGAQSLATQLPLASGLQPGEFNSNLVSESQWEQWRNIIANHALGEVQLGRLAPTLQALPTVIWRMPLSTYFGYSIAQLRHLKTHGEKRVAAILEVFYSLYELLGNSPQPPSHLALRIVPKFIVQLETWVTSRLEKADLISEESVRESLAIPLVKQIQIDCGQTIGRLAEGRLGLHGAPQSVRLQAKRMSVTRARVYQLLGECQQAITVRWPEGCLLLTCLQQHLSSLQPEPKGLKLLQAVVNLFFPDDDEMLRRKLEKNLDR
ncbi:MAG TPA: hypothetical protein VFE46_03975 [Pirellulales bacterium]|jgi:hypothetical protein|nr:hypothetical protein [Pirellulales bacterium]